MVKKKIPKKLEATIKNYITILQEDNLPIEKVILFGSYAKGAQNKWSDVDIAVVSPKFKDHWEALHYLHQKTNNKEPYYIEPHGLTLEDFDDKYDTLAYEVEKHGIEIKV